MNPERIKHLELIQGVVNRLAGNSFSMKGWTVAIIAGLFALSAKDANPYMVLITLMPSLCFWGLDSYYLRQERLFRALYNSSILENTSIPLFSMNIKLVEKKVASFCSVFFSRTIFWFHFPIFITILIFITKKLIIKH